MFDFSSCFLSVFRFQQKVQMQENDTRENLHVGILSQTIRYPLSRPLD